MRPYVPGEDMTGVSVSAPDYMLLAGNPDPGGFIARNPKNHADQWYVSQTYFEENLEPVDPPPRDPAAELRAAVKVWAKAFTAESTTSAAADEEPSQERFEAWQEARCQLEEAEQTLYALAATEGES
jgi:hypothetical protein